MTPTEHPPLKSYRCWYCHRTLLEADPTVRTTINLRCRRCGKENAITTA